MPENNAVEFKNVKYGPLPRAGMPVQVQCSGFKCMAYLDREGKWRDLFSREPLMHVLGVVPD
jgi:hypothetical protein